MSDKLEHAAFFGKQKKPFTLSLPLIFKVRPARHDSCALWYREMVLSIEKAPPSTFIFLHGNQHFQHSNLSLPR